MSQADDESALDSTIRHTLRDVRNLPVEAAEAAMRRIHWLSCHVKRKGETPDRRALIRQAYSDLARRIDGAPSASELAEWVRL